MPKILLEDMVKKHPRKDIRENRQIKKIPEPRELPKKEENEVNNTKSKSRYMLWFVAFISLGFFVFAVSYLFSSAEITVSPKIKNIVLNKNISVSKDSSSDDLYFNSMVIDGVENKIIKATEEKDVKEVATGDVIIYNVFSSSSQILVKDTRLEGSNGKIYKIQEKSIVPGMVSANTPGSVEVKIYGVDVGEAYNSPPIDFKIFGFKGTPKYSKFYGRSVGDITGGFIGKAPVVSDAEKMNAINLLKDTLQAKLLQKATNQIPAGFILFKDAIFFNANDSDLSFVYNKDNSLTLTQKGTLHGILFDERKLTKKITEGDIEKDDNAEIYLSNIRDLKFSFNDEGNTILSSDVNNIDFNLTGSTKIVWKLDVDKFTSDLLGKSKKEFNQILAQYPSIDTAILKLSPFWKISIPDQFKNIKVIVNYPK